MFDGELGYYGINSGGSLTDQTSLQKIRGSLTAPVVDAEGRLDVLRKEHGMFLLALECNNQFCQSQSQNKKANSIQVIILARASTSTKVWISRWR